MPKYLVCSRLVIQTQTYLPLKHILFPLFHVLSLWTLHFDHRQVLKAIVYVSFFQVSDTISSQVTQNTLAWEKGRCCVHLDRLYNHLKKKRGGASSKHSYIIPLIIYVIKVSFLPGTRPIDALSYFYFNSLKYFLCLLK